MDIAAQTFTAISNLYSGMNKATLSGAIDVVVVRQPDGTLKCSPFHVRFGKLNVWSPAEKRVKLWINGVEAPVEMKLGPGGEAFFVSKLSDDQPVNKNMITSPITVHRASENARTPTPADGRSAETTPVGTFDLEEICGPEQGEPTSEATPKTSPSSLPLATDTSPPTLAPDSEGDDDAASEDDPISSWHWGSLPEQGSNRGDEIVAGARRRHRLTSTSSNCSDGGTASPRFQVVNVSKTLLQTLALQQAAEGLGVEMGESAAVGPGVSLTKGDILLSINGIGTDMMDVSQVRMIVDAIGTESVELVLSSGPMPVSATPRWIRQLGRAFRDHGLGAREPNSESVSGAVSSGGVALSLCGSDNIGEFDKHRVTFKKFEEDSAALLSNPALVVMIGGEAYNWESAAPLLLSVAAYGQVPGSAKALPLDADAASLVVGSEEQSTRSWWFFGSRSQRSPQESRSRSSTASEDLPQPNDAESMGETYSKTLTLDSDQLKSLNLKPGENEALFCVTSKMQGKALVQCVVHLWEHDDAVVISDIDGTITRSDIMGHAASLIGTDWTHEGVAGLYTLIHKNGYKFLYLTSRSISHASLTRLYIDSVEQDSGVKLPRGPIMFSPDNFLASIHREVIARNPQEFKIACLQSIADLFPQQESVTGVPRPFVAGFGNRHTDEESYAAVNVPPDRVFTIDPSGNLKMGTGLQNSTYVALQERYDLYFPPVNQGDLAKQGLDKSGRGDPSPKRFSDVEYWNSAKDFMSKVDINDELKALLGTA